MRMFWQYIQKTKINVFISEGVTWDVVDLHGQFLKICGFAKTNMDLNKRHFDAFWHFLRHLRIFYP